MIDLQELVYALNEYLGRDKFALYLNTNGAPSDDNRIVGTAVVGRVPYGFTTDEIDAESLNITMTFDLPCGTDKDDLTRDEALYTIAQKLLSWKRIKIEYADGSTYALNTFLEMQPPSNPYIDNGRITQQIVVSGNALMQNANCGAVVGNREIVLINGQQMLKLDKVSSTQFTADNNIPLSEGSMLPSMQNVAYANTMRVSFLYMGTAIDDAFYAIGEGEVEDANKEYVVAVMRLLDNDTAKTVSEKICKVVSVTNTSTAGVFNKYEVVFQKVGERPRD
jgi:hypothetical protein